MSDAIISVENLGKKYRIAHQQSRQRYTALRDVIAHKLTAPFRALFGRYRKPSAFGLTPDLRHLTSDSGASVSSTEDFWALKDVSLEVKRGEAVGIIGRNGAGKSTLLKILSRITEPTEGRVRLRGRVASLLEVGTGFHPELTGRENVFLNGAILGMRRDEIRRKFDQIVAFAEIEKFLDTPVKRYSTGMYVRLAFAVAAHLEPEILIIDEVLAVGDAEFQKKCLGKMSEVAQGGRTVLFVSHNMAAVSSLTSRGIVLNAGQVLFRGATNTAIEKYLQLSSRNETMKGTLGRGKHTAILSVELVDGAGKPTGYYAPGQSLHLEITLETDGSSSLSMETFLLDANRNNIALASLHHFLGRVLPDIAGTYRCLLAFEPVWLASGNYTFNVTTSVVNSHWDHYVEEAVQFSVAYSNPGGQSWDFKQTAGYGVFGLVCKSPPQFILQGQPTLASASSHPSANTRAANQSAK